jgi:hypothetical protein
MTKNICKQHPTCLASDSKLAICKCWCAECKDIQAEYKRDAYKITIVKGAN